MANGLKSFVHVRNPETLQYEAFGPEDDLPSWFEKEVDAAVFETAGKAKKSTGTRSTGGSTESVKDLRTRIAEVSDLDALRDELKSEDREGAKKALESRIRAVSEEQLSAGSYVFETVEELEDYVTGATDAENLGALRAAEEAGPNRTTALDAFDKAIAAATSE